MKQIIYFLALLGVIGGVYYYKPFKLMTPSKSLPTGPSSAALCKVNELWPGFFEGFAPVKMDGKWGYINQEGKIAILPRYTVALNFGQQMAPARQGDKFCYLYRDGTVLIPKEYKLASPFHEDIAVASKNGKRIFINRRNKKVIEQDFKGAGRFSEGLAPARSDDKWGYINTQGKWAIAPKFEWAQAFTEGLGCVRISKANNQWGYLDRSGTVVKQLRCKRAMPLINGIAPILSLDDKYGFINRDGGYVVGPKFDGASWFNEGLAPVKEGGLWGYIDMQGEMKIAPQFDRASCFSQGRAYVEMTERVIGGKVKPVTGYIKTDGAFFWRYEGNPVDPSPISD